MGRSLFRAPSGFRGPPRFNPLILHSIETSPCIFLDVLDPITYIRTEMTPRRRKLYSFWIDPDQAAALKVVKERDGVPESEQIRRAIDTWLETKRVKRKATRRLHHTQR